MDVVLLRPFKIAQLGRDNYFKHFSDVSIRSFDARSLKKVVLLLKINPEFTTLGKGVAS